jgi:hypothetical protein
MRIRARQDAPQRGGANAACTIRAEELESYVAVAMNAERRQSLAV